MPFRMAANGANGRLRKHGGEKADTAGRGKSRIPDTLQDTTLEEKAHKVFWLTTQKIMSGYLTSQTLFIFDWIP